MKTLKGSPQPLGATITKKGTNFAIWSKNATAITLCLFDENGVESQFSMERTDDVFHLEVERVGEGQRYGFRVSGNTNSQTGAFFNPKKLLLDPYARKIDGKPIARNDKELEPYQWDSVFDNGKFAPKSVVVGINKFDWSDNKRPHYTWAESIIYEAHVKGFSKLNKQIPKPLRGTYAGLAHENSIKYLKKLGITAIELQPVYYMADEVHLQRMGLTNYWGYSVLGHFAVEPHLAVNKSDPITEFKMMVDALHKAGIEVILDVVYNHTVEGGKGDLTLCQRGIDNQSYYWLDGRADYYNWTGCGNALNLSHPNVCQWAIDSLAYWVEEFHIDGFRFDLATTTGRKPEFSHDTAFLQTIRKDKRFANIKFIAEPWDIGFDGYQVGHFPQEFAEWNDKYRLTMRDFFCNESGRLDDFARRLAGSDDLYWQYSPSKSINYFASHDGFCLQDLVSYNHKHNEANGEQNRDGEYHNLSNNHGVEGETDNEFVNLLRNQTACSLLAALFLSNGVPMLRMGDELGHSQQGNNNAYCQDNKMTWINWQNIDQERLRYVKKLIDLRKKIPLLSHQSHWWTENDVEWLSINGYPMQKEEWLDTHSKALQILLQDHWLILINGKKATQKFIPPKGKWHIYTGRTVSTLYVEKDQLYLQLEQMGICVLQRK